MLKFRFQFTPTDGILPVLVEAFEAAVNFHLLRGGQGYPVVFEAVPKLRDERKAFGR
jgi:hypothetical protein